MLDYAYEIVRVEKRLFASQKWFIMMELCATDVSRHFNETSPDMSERMRIMFECSAGLEFLHENKIIHRDLKPANLLLKEEDGKMTVKICDYGLSRELLTESATLTSDVGTRDWRSPESYDFIEKCEQFTS